MAMTAEDRAAITELISLHGHLCDSGELGRLAEVFTADVEYDLTDFGQQTLRPAGVRISRRKVLARRVPLGG